MIVFKGYLKGIKRNYQLVLTYLFIFLVIGTIFGYAAKTEVETNYTEERCQVAMIDLDDTVFSRGLRKYMEKYHDLVDLPNDKKVLSEELYNNNIQFVITIPQGAEEDCMQGEGRISTTSGVSQQNSWYIGAKVDEYVNFMRTYGKAGYSTEDALEKVLALSECKAVVTFGKNRTNGDLQTQLGFSFRYLPYVMIAILCLVLGTVFQEYRGSDIKRRLRASSLSLRRQNGEALLAFLVIGCGLYVICMLLTIALSGKAFFTNGNLGYFAVNAFCMILVSLSLAFFVGTVSKETEALNGLANVLSLAMCFLGGVFVPEYMFTGGMRKTAMFFPTFWYERNNTMLDQHQVLTDALKTTIYQGYGFQILFACACVCVSLLVIKAKDQEKE